MGSYLPVTTMDTNHKGTPIGIAFQDIPDQILKNAPDADTREIIKKVVGGRFFGVPFLLSMVLSVETYR